MKGPTVRHRIEYGAFRSAAGIAGLVPEWAADGFGAGVGWLAARLAPVRWGVVSRQLAAAFPDRDPAWRRAVGRACYAHLGAETMAMVHLAGLGREEVVERTRVQGLEAVEEAVAGGRGVIVVTGHLGNWEIGGAALAARGLPVDVVVARQRNRLFDRHLTGSRERLGMHVIPRGEARPRVLASLRAGRVVGILGDQDARRAGVFVDFFGRPAATARGPALLALRTGALLVTGTAIRKEGRRPRYDVTIEPLGIEPTGELARDVLSLTQAFTKRLEDCIRNHPEQYFWLHRRWKTQAPAAGGQRGAGMAPEPRSDGAV